MIIKIIRCPKCDFEAEDEDGSPCTVCDGTGILEFPIECHFSKSRLFNEGASYSKKEEIQEEL